MPELIDLKFYEKITDKKSFKKIKQIFQWQKEMLQFNKMPLNIKSVSLFLDGHDVFVEASSAVNALEIYQEIFRDNDHAGLALFIPSPDMRVVFDIGAKLWFLCNVG